MDRLHLVHAPEVGVGPQLLVAGHGQHEGVPGHAHGVPPARALPLPATLLAAPEALLDPVAAGVQGRVGVRRQGVGQQKPGLPLALGVQHHQRAGQGVAPESRARAQPERARTTAQGPVRDPVAAGWSEGDVQRVAQDGMPAQFPNPRPQLAAAQPLAAQDVHRCPGRDTGASRHSRRPKWATQELWA